MALGVSFLATIGRHRDKINTIARASGKDFHQSGCQIASVLVLSSGTRLFISLPRAFVEQMYIHFK